MQQQKEQSAKEQRRNYEDYAARVKKYKSDQKLVDFSIKYQKSDAEKGVAEFEKKGFSDQSVSDVLSYGINKFFVFLDSNQYLTEKSYKREISKISNQSAVVFFIVVQLPLSRISPGWSFLTCFLAWFIDHTTKKWIYDVVRCILTINFKGFK